MSRGAGRDFTWRATSRLRLSLSERFAMAVGAGAVSSTA